MYSFQSIKFELVLQVARYYQSDVKHICVVFLFWFEGLNVCNASKALFFNYHLYRRKKTICFYTRENICGPQCKVWRAQISLINVFHKLCSACACTPRVCALYCNMPRIIWLYAAILYFCCVTTTTTSSSLQKNGSELLIYNVFNNNFHQVIIPKIVFPTREIWSLFSYSKCSL